MRVLESFVGEAAKGINPHKDLAEFSQKLTKITVEATGNAERDGR